MIFEDPSTIAEALAKWQRKLRLQDWDVVVSIERASKLDGMQGRVMFVRQKKFARIWLLDAPDFPEDTAWPQDHEITLVHELLHLYTVTWTGIDEETASVEEEQMIEALSRLLVQQEREICRLLREKGDATDGGSSFPSDR